MAVEQGGCVGNDGLALSAALVLDPRLAEVWQLVWATAARGEEADDEAWSLETLAALLRLAYVQGYADAAGESVPGSLFVELGVRRPPRVIPLVTRNRRARGRSRRGSSGM